MRFIIFPAMLFAGITAFAAQTDYDAVVARDGSGTHTNVQSALAAAPENGTKPFVIFIKPGTYQGQIIVPKEKKHVKFVGEDHFTCGGGTSDVLITNCAYGFGHGVSIGSPTYGGVSNITVINCTFNNTEQGIRIKSDRDRGGVVQNLSYFNLRMTNVGCPILIYGSYMNTNRAYRALTDLASAIAAGYPSNAVTSRTPAYRDITFSNLTATVQSGRRAGLIWGLPEMPVTNVLLQQVRISAHKPFGIYDAQNVRLVDCQIITPDGVNRLSCTNSHITITPP